MTGAPAAPAPGEARDDIPQRVPRQPRWSHGYEFSLTTQQLDDVIAGRARTAEDFGSGPSVKVTLADVSPYRLLATIEVLLEERAALAPPASRPASSPAEPKAGDALAIERASKDRAYDERNRLVAFLASLYPSSLERHPEGEEWEDDWRWIVFVDGPTGQLSWHIHDSHLPLFDHLPRLTGRKWDGHTTEEKYRRLALASRAEPKAHGGGDAEPPELTEARRRVERNLSTRRFVLSRDVDVSGVSGTGIVAWGVLFPDGVVALRWCSAWPTSVVFHDRSMEAVKAVHGHDGKTRIVWLDEESDHD